MRSLFFLCLLVIGWGCQAAPTQTGSAAEPIALTTAEFKTLDVQRQTFLSEPDLSERLQRLLELEQQALQLAVDEPLKLGSIGSAILDLYPGSQTGHYAMSRFYAHVETPEAKAMHDDELRRLQQYMRREGASGTADAPYKVMTIYDARTFARSEGVTPVGSIYQIPDMASFRLVLINQPRDAGLTSAQFDLSHLVQAFTGSAPHDEEEDAGNAHAQAGIDNPWRLLQVLAAQMDTAAQTAIGRFLMRQQKYDEAISWLQVASRSGNVLANTSLARIYLLQAEAAEDDAQQEELRELAMENHLHAIALGSTDAMYTLANLYINDYYGEDNRGAALPLLRKAGELGHAESLLYLGYLYNAGREVDQDVGKAASYFARAAALDNPQAILSYGRFLTGREDIGADAEDVGIQQRLQGLAEDGDAEAMVILGNLHARGVTAKASTRTAVRWYKKAIKATPEEAEIVNEVAWTLTVSDVPGLKRPRYAQSIMDALMTSNEAARARPEYLDTWAATYAATGDFERAIELQQEAIAQAASQARDDVLEILQGHLEIFKAGATITEKAP